MIILAGTPIGNLGDASRRLVEALGTARHVAAEDTRVTIQLMRALGVENRPALYAAHDHNERERAAELVELAREEDLLVLSDAGMPTVWTRATTWSRRRWRRSRGHRAARAVGGADGARRVRAPDGPLQLRGLPPRRHGERVSTFRALVDERRTMVFFESPHRIGDALADLVEAMGPERRVVVCRELTKMFEEVRRGTAAELAEWAADGLRGEICLVVEGAPAREASLEDALADVLARVEAGSRLKEASAEVAEITGLSRRALYEAALASRRG